MKEIRTSPYFNQGTIASSKEAAEQKLRDVANLYEKQFLREMVKAMRATVQEGGLIKRNQAEQIFREQLDNELVEKWGDTGGVGLSRMLFDQLVEKFGSRMGIRNPPEKPIGPFALRENDTIHSVAPQNFKEGRSSLNFHYRLGQQTEAEIVAPWSGKLVSSWQDEGARHNLDIQHENGFRSKMLFSGDLVAGFSQDLSAGQRLGFVNGSNPSFSWQLSRDEDK